MSDGYQLLDCGNGRKLEAVGPYRIDRQAPQAFWSPRRGPDDWSQVDAIHHRSEQGGGHWEFRRRLPDAWDVTFGGLTFQVKPTPFGHLGVFPEQAPNWQWMRGCLESKGSSEPSVLNLFGYTGLGSLACAQVRAQVCHVDAAKGIVDWAAKNASLSGLQDAKVRWIVDDCARFVDRESRRGKRYDGILLDPPTFGRGAKKEPWKIEEDLIPLLGRLGRLLTDQPAFFLLSCHTPGWSPLVLTQVLEDALGPGWTYESGEMEIPADSVGRRLPSGTFVRAVPG